MYKSFISSHTKNFNIISHVLSYSYWKFLTRFIEILKKANILQEYFASSPLPWKFQRHNLSWEALRNIGFEKTFPTLWNKIFFFHQSSVLQWNCEYILRPIKIHKKIRKSYMINQILRITWNYNDQCFSAFNILTNQTSVTKKNNNFTHQEMGPHFLWRPAHFQFPCH